MSATHDHSVLKAARYSGSAGLLQWLLVVILGIVAVILGAIGFRGEDGKFMDWADAIYNSLRLFHMHFDRVPCPLPITLQIARFLAPFILLIAVLKGFFLVVRSQQRDLIHRGKRGHVVICGLGHKGLQLARQYRRQGDWVIVIENDPENPLLPLCDDEGIFCRAGDATESAVLRHARVTHAKEVVVVTPEDETNVRIASEIRRLCGAEHRTGLQCFVHLENIHLRERLQRLVENEPGKPSGCTLHFFDVYDGEARRVLLELPLDGTGIGKGDPRSVHVVILGFGRMGRSLALRAAKMGHFANNKKLRISVIDRCGDHQREKFLFHFPALENDTICEMRFYEHDAQSLSVRKLVEAWAAEPDTLLQLFVCLDDNARAVETSLGLQEALNKRAGGNLCVRVKTQASLAKILEQSTAMVGPRMVTFGMVEDACCDQAFRREYNENIAKCVHDEFVRKRLADSNRTAENDPALQPWDNLREDFRESCRQQADHIHIKLHAIGCESAPASDPREAITKFKADEIELLAELEHARWNTERWLAGWRYGTPTDKARRISANLVAWNSLDDSIRKYDREAVAEIPTLLAAAKPPLKVVARKSS